MHSKGKLNHERAEGSVPLPSALPPTGEELLHFFDESLDLFCIAGLDGMFKHLNPAWQQVLGWTPAELRSRPFLDFVHRDDRAVSQAEVGKLAEGAATINFENRYQCKDGAWKWLQWTARPSPAGRDIYAIARDVGVQKRMEKAILHTLDRERERMGRELHDGLCQTLAGIAALGSTLSRRLAARSESATSAMAAEIATLLNESIVHARDRAQHGSSARGAPGLPAIPRHVLLVVRSRLPPWAVGHRLGCGATPQARRTRCLGNCEQVVPLTDFQASLARSL